MKAQPLLLPLRWTKDKSLPLNTKTKSWKMVEACGGGELFTKYTSTAVAFLLAISISIHPVSLLSVDLLFHYLSSVML